MRNFLFFLLVWMLVTGCDEAIDLDLQQAKPLLVIEGWLTNNPDKNYVKITRTVSFYDTITPPAVRSAQVVLTGTDGVNVTFLPYGGNEPDSMAYYFPETPITGTPGEIYTLSVTENGETYQASDTLNIIQSIDSLNSYIDPLEQANPADSGRFYQVLLYTKEPQDTKDYYLFRFYRNGTQERAFPDDIYVADDLLLGDYFNGVRTPVYYHLGDTAKLEMYKITRQSYLYYVDLQVVINNDGGMFSPPPSNPRNNFNQQILGHFTVASLVADSLIIE